MSAPPASLSVSGLKTEIWDLAAGTFIAVSVVGGKAAELSPASQGYFFAAGSQREGDDERAPKRRDLGPSRRYDHRRFGC